MLHKKWHVFGLVLALSCSVSVAAGHTSESPAKEAVRLHSNITPANAAPAAPTPTWTGEAARTPPVATPHVPTLERWPKTFFQDFSRSQDGQTEDAHFKIRFTAVPSGQPPCIQVKFRMDAEYASRRTYYRRRLDTLSLFNTGPIAAGGVAESAPFVTDEIRRNRQQRQREEGNRPTVPIPSIFPRSKSMLEISTPQKTSPVYISNGTENGDGELIVACVRDQGNYSGTVEVKASVNAPEKITIPWSFRLESTGISTVSFKMNEIAVPDHDEWRGDLHPRRKLNAGERLENVGYRLVNSSRYPTGAPEAYYDGRFPLPPDAGREIF